MNDGRRKLPSWMLGVKSNENNYDISNNNGCQNEEDKGKLVKGCRPTKRVNVKKRKNDLDDDGFEVDLSDEQRVHDVGSRVTVTKMKNYGDDDEFEEDLSDEPTGRDGGNRRRKRKINGDSGYVESDNESREGKKKGRDMGHKMKGNIVDDEIGYGKRKNSAKVRKETLRSKSNLVDSDDYDYADEEILGGKRSTRLRKWKGKGKTDKLEEDEVEDDDDGFGAQIVMRKCKGKRRAVRGKLIDCNDLVDVQGALTSNTDDEDLTVEDLVSIAQEYVNKDREAKQQLSLSQGVSDVGNLTRIRKEHTKENEDICENNASKTSINDNTQRGESSNSKLLSREEARSHNLLNENVTVIKPIMTGDPTKDMLDLLLGHLLKKPQEEENKLDFSVAVQRQEPAAAPLDAVPYTKKKSSLKDKVAMFFD